MQCTSNIIFWLASRPEVGKPKARAPAEWWMYVADVRRVLKRSVQFEKEMRKLRLGSRDSCCWWSGFGTVVWLRKNVVMKVGLV